MHTVDFIRHHSFIHLPPLQGYFQGWGGWACIAFGRVKFVWGAGTTPTLNKQKERSKDLSWNLGVHPSPESNSWSCFQQLLRAWLFTQRSQVFQCFQCTHPQTSQVLQCFECTRPENPRSCSIFKGIMCGNPMFSLERPCASRRCIDALKKIRRALKKRGRVLKKRGRVLKKRGRVLKKRGRVLKKRGGVLFGKGNRKWAASSEGSGGALLKKGGGGS